ncbi:hypothetical protein ACHAXN_012231 [Cyclotella atomus]
MPKRKRSSSSPSAQTFSLMEGNIDLLEGLIMHKEAISQEFENELVDFVQSQCAKGRKGEIKKPTYLRAAGTRSQGNQRESLIARPGKRGIVPPFPPILDRLVDHLINSNLLPADVRPDSCIINQYDKGDCIPPHVDHASYYRPISTLSLLGEEPMLVGSKFRTVRSCTWIPTVGKTIPLPRRSLLVLGGNSGNIAKHCISSCKGKRISITLRKQPDPDWKPDESELAGKKRSVEQKHNVVGGKEAASDDVTDKPKKKALSGSAKRRKKMMKQRGPVEPKCIETKGSGANSTTNNAQSPVVNMKRQPKSGEKQAKRNAKRMLKKRAEKNGAQS